jgi:phospholipase C
MSQPAMRLFVSLALIALASCATPNGGVRSVPNGLPLQESSIGSGRAAGASAKLKHIVIIIQENRSVDNLFNGFCAKASVCANTVTKDPISGTPLKQESLAAPFDPFHDRSQFVTEYDNGKMDGFTRAGVICNNKAPCPYTVFSYVPKSETAIYRKLAQVDGELSDETFQTNQGPSFPAHLYAIGGQSGGYDSDHFAIDAGSGTCGKKKQVKTLNMTVPYPGAAGPNVTSCLDFQTILDLVVAKGHTWHYYSNSASSFWSAPQSILHLYNSPNFSFPSTKFLTDIAAGTLADVTFIMPDSYEDSDHPSLITNPLDGPNWVASLVNAVGESQFWDSSAIVIWWDDWGGFFDHVKPSVPPGTPPSWMGNPDPYEYAFRVPMIVVSPYAKLGRIDHQKRSFVSAIRLIEDTFQTGSLGTTDQYEPASGLNPMFDFSQSPRKYVPVGGANAQPRAHLGGGNPTDAESEPDGY